MKSWENKIDINQIMEIRSKTFCYFGVGAIEKINDILDQLKARGIDSVLVVTDEIVYKITGAWDVVEPALKARGMRYKVFTGVVPNPTVEGIDESVDMGKEIEAGAVIGIGGGSSIDSAKAAASLLHPKYHDKTAREMFLIEFEPDVALPIVAINTTHGTGTEVDRFSVASINDIDYKPGPGYECWYPTWAIDDPGLMTKLPPKLTVYTALDSLNHVSEAASSTLTNPYVINMAIDVADKVATYLPKIIENPDDMTARYYLVYAAMSAGICFDNGLLHLTHAIEHPLSGINPKLYHGLGLSAILPSILKNTYAGCPEILADVYSSIVPGLKGVKEENVELAARVESWLADMGVPERLGDLGFVSSDVDHIVDLTFNTPIVQDLIDLSPVPADRELVTRIVEESFAPIAQAAKV